MIPFSERYVSLEPLIRLAGGTLYKGKDAALHRQVLLYRASVQGEERELLLKKIGYAGQEPAASSLHILDAFCNLDDAYIILTYEEGIPLLHMVKKMSTLSASDIVPMVLRLGHALLDNLEERPLQYSLHASNLWLCKDGTLLAINTWDAGEPELRASTRLCGLLFQLLARAGTVPASVEAFEKQLRAALTGIPAGSRERLMEPCRHAMSGRLSLAAFVRQLQEWQWSLAMDAATAAGSADDAAAWHTPAVAQAVEELQEETPRKEMARAGFTSAPVTATSRDEAIPVKHEDLPVPAPARRREPVIPMDDEEDELAEKSEHAKPAFRRFASALFHRKLWLGLGIAVVSLVVFAGVFVLLLETVGRQLRPEPAEQEAAATKATSAPQGQTPTPKPPQATTTTTQTPLASGQSPSEAPKPQSPPADNGSSTATVPTLTGLTRDAAEKQVLAAGLKYEFKLEAHPQAAGTVFKQEPAANESVPKNTRITFWVSKGQP